MAHVSYVFFGALFESEKKNSKILFFYPLNPLFWKNLKFWVFQKKCFGGMWHMFHTCFLEAFSNLILFFFYFRFLTLLTPLLWQKLKILNFLKKPFWGIWHMFHMCFLKHFSNLNFSIQNFNFLTLLTPLFWQKLKFLVFEKNVSSLPPSFSICSIHIINATSV